MAAPPSSRAPRAGCPRKHKSSLTSFGIFTVGRGRRYVRLLAGPCSSCAGKKPTQLLRRHSGAVRPSPALAWPCSSPATITPALVLEPVCLSKEREATSNVFVCPFLKLQELCSEKQTLCMKTPDGKTKCAVVTDREQREWNVGIPGLSFMPKLRITVLQHMMLQ